MTLLLNRLYQRAARSFHTDRASIHAMHQQIAQGQEDAFYVVNTAALLKRHALWKGTLPRVHPFYAVKCNPDPQILTTLARIGCGFDCASRPEIQSVLNCQVHPNRIIYANPCKQASHIRWAKEQGIQTVTFDSMDELEKMATLYPESQLVLRLHVDDTHSQCQLGSKFGAPLTQVPELMRYAKRQQLNVIGVSFHVGSGCYDSRAYVKAVADARKAFDMAADAGFHPYVLDIGGGFPGDDTNPAISFPAIAKCLNTALDFHFPQEQDIHIIAEPGRFYAASTHTLAVNVIGRKLVSATSPQTTQFPSAMQIRRMQTANADLNFMYYVNDGLYGSFNCIMYDHATVHPVVLNKQPTRGYRSSIWGPTCDGLDCIMKDIELPLLNIGQWMYFANMGAYTSAASSAFNGFSPPEKIYIDNDDEEVVEQATFL